METVTQSKILSELGRRVRQARIQRGFSQEELAKPQFTKSYVSAIERGKARPSLKALEFLAQQLGIPATELLVEHLPNEAQQSQYLLEEDLAFQLDCARRAIDTDHAGDGLQLISVAQQNAGSFWESLEPYTRFRFAYLRALAYIRLLEPAAALNELNLARDLAAKLDDNGEALLRIDNLEGGAYYQQGLAAAAAARHEQCVKRIENGVSQDLNLRLLVYSNLANDYLAMGQTDNAIKVYRAALALLDDVSNLERQSAIHWGMCLAYKKAGDLHRAKLHASAALDIYEAAQNINATAKMSVNLADILTQREEFAEAEQLLERARGLVGGDSNPLFLSEWYDRYAELTLRQGHFDRAAEYAAQELALSKQAYEQANADEHDAQSATAALHNYIAALGMAGRIAELQHDADSADTYFKEAVELARHPEAWDLSREIARSYADVLSDRGQHEQAGYYYREALEQKPLRPRR